jgi:methionyl-tRNA synthetase
MNPVTLICERCQGTFPKTRGKQKYCVACKPVMYLEILKRTQKKYFQTEKGRKATLKAWYKSKEKRTQAKNTIEAPISS